MLDKIMFYIAFGAISIVIIGFIFFLVKGLIEVIKNAFEDKKHMEYEDWLQVILSILALCIIIPACYFGVKLLMNLL